MLLRRYKYYNAQLKVEQSVSTGANGQQQTILTVMNLRLPAGIRYRLHPARKT